MGQAKRRGTLEERKANPNPPKKYWHDDPVKLAEFKASIATGLGEYITYVRGELFETRKSKVKRWPTRKARLVGSRRKKKSTW